MPQHNYIVSSFPASLAPSARNSPPLQPMQAPMGVATINGGTFTLQHNNPAGVNIGGNNNNNNNNAGVRMYSRDEPSVLHSSGRIVNPNIVQVSSGVVRSGMSTPSYVPRMSIQPPPPAPVPANTTTTTVHYQQPVYGQVNMHHTPYSGQYATPSTGYATPSTQQQYMAATPSAPHHHHQYATPSPFTTNTAAGGGQYTPASASQQYTTTTTQSAPVFTTYYSQTAPTSGAQTPSRPPLGSHQQHRAGMYGMHSVPASLPRTPYNEPAVMSPYKPMMSDARTSYSGGMDHMSSYAHRYSPDQAEMRVRNLIADTERMLAGLSVPSKPDGLTL